MLSDEFCLLDEESYVFNIVRLLKNIELFPIHPNVLDLSTSNDNVSIRILLSDMERV